jgi:hypothetical protein
MLGANRAELKSRGIDLALPENLRPEWLPSFVKYARKLASSPGAVPPENLAAIAPTAGTLILSEENIIGVPNDLTRHAGLYPFSKNRIKALTNVFPHAEIRIFFSLRSYETFYRSAYSEIIRNRGFLRFDKFYDPVRFEHNSWLGVVAGMAQVVPKSQITLWSYEDFRKLAPTIISMLTDGMDAAEMMARYDKKTTRPSLSRKTIEILGDLEPVLDRVESIRFAKRLSKAYPVVSSDDEYRPFPQSAEAAMREQYNKDMISIRERFPEIHYLTPSP